MHLYASKKVPFLIVCLLISGLALAATTAAQTYYYPLSQCKLSTSVNYSGAGYVSPSGQNILYYYGSTITVRAYTYQGYVFDGWYLNGVYQGKLSTITLLMTQDYSLYAVFSQRTAVLTINSNPSDGGSTTPGSGLWNCSYGSTIQVTEYPANGNTFSGWYLDGVYQGLGSTITVPMSQDHQLSAFFSGNGSVPTPPPTPTPAPTQTPYPNLPVPNLSFYCVSSTTTSGFNVRIQGALAYNQTGISGAGIVFSYSATGGSTWHDLAYVITGDDGNFSAVWMPAASGNYMVRATWPTDGVYSSVSTDVNFAVQPNPEDQMFSVSSNSTLSSLSFNSEAGELSFTVSGPSGTFGYVEACIPKTLLPDTSTLAVLLDGVNTPYTVLSQGDTWIVNIMYHHSTHSVVMALNSPDGAASYPPHASSSDTSSPSIGSDIAPIVVLPLIVVIIGLAVFVALRRRVAHPVH